MGRKLAQIVIEANLPMAELAVKMARSKAVLTAISQGRRARTLKKRFQSWAKCRRFLILSTGSPWPKSSADFINYIQALIDGEASKAQLFAVHSALCFIEKGGGVRSGTAIGEQDLIENFVEEGCLQRSVGSTSPTKKAPQYPVAILGALERTVTDVSLKVFVQMISWWKCI